MAPEVPFVVRIRFPLAALIALAGAALADVRIDARSSIVIDPSEPAALRRAAADLASDMSKVFGATPAVVGSSDAASSSAVHVCLSARSCDGLRPGGAEVLAIRAVPGGVMLTGSDLRGAIYAVYEFSRRFLGVDPFYYWNDHEPARMVSVRIPADASIQDGPPQFRYRGWFINDEDLFTGWKPDPASGFSLELWDKIFETLLRVKGNMIVPGTFLFPDEPQVAAASERGLIITQHHIEVVGLNTYRWPEDIPYSFLSRPDLLKNAWRASVRGYKPQQEVIWTVGYRGRHDRAFWEDDASGDKSERGRAEVIQRAIQAEMEIVRAERPNPVFLMNAWDEAVPLVRKGYLKIPSGVTLVWPDNGHGIIRDDGALTRGEGVYYHTAMHNFMANQLTEMVPLARIQRELGRAARVGATEYLLVNVSDIRPVVMTTEAAMELAWNADAWMKQDGAASRAYLAGWTRREFGERASAALVDYYNAYFAAPGRYGTAEDRTFSDCAYNTLARHILTKLLIGKTEKPEGDMPVENYRAFAERLRKIAAQAEPRWTAARDLAGRAAKLIAPDRKQFFQSHVATQLDVHEYGNRALLRIAEAYLAGSPAERKRYVAAAIADLERILASYQASEYGKWAGYYRGELFANVRLTHRMAHAYAGVLDGKPIPAGLPVQARTPDPYPTLKAYQGARRTTTAP
jgi:hypothetical protein